MMSDLFFVSPDSPCAIVFNPIPKDPVLANGLIGKVADK